MAEKYKKTKQRDEQYCQHIVTVQLKQCDRLLKDALEKQSDEQHQKPIRRLANKELSFSC